MITVDQSLKLTQIDQAAKLLVKFSREEAFWSHFHNWIAMANLSQHDLLEVDAEIFTHIKTMFSFDLNILIVGYRTKWPMSSVIGHAEGNRIKENLWKLNSLTLPARVGHLGHETCHLFGYRHEFQGQRTSASVVFGEAMEAYAERRIAEMSSVLLQ